MVQHVAAIARSWNHQASLRYGWKHRMIGKEEEEEDCSGMTIVDRDRRLRARERKIESGN